MMLKILKETHIRFSQYRYIGFIVSGALIVLTLVLLLIKGGPNYGIDFLGGSKIGVSFSEDISTDEIRMVLSDLGETEVKIFRIQDVSTGTTTYQIQIPPKTELVDEEAQKTFSTVMLEEFQSRYPDQAIEITGEETVSAAFGRELQWKAILALLIGFALVLIYIGIRIDFKFGIGTVLAVIHDVWITLGIVTLLGVRLDITAIAAFLTIVGYSVNDSIVVSKRIQELIKTRRGAGLAENVDAGINAALSRTLVTSITTLFVAVSLAIFAGGTAIYPFAMIMTVGVIIGTYSSAFIVAPVVVEMDRIFPSRKKKR
ncbi:protein translocase subunit SecF [candidate division WOR-3 bacterium]|uniref:Protein-export membrane protein SecF n=1 Tax=candidate division WOR-3 bacterium TaxID=2052148 RepID=A0A9D5K800_UNCW3|nr:protein translocase subunit SecF [candidate division WOR-3 bacterium]MBD3363922.1 protein translocase subunit SecF [candidate division WOR-3 bacterium]